MRRTLALLGAAACAALSIGTAQAQSRQPMWQGLYVGVHAGGVFGDVTIKDPGGSFTWDHGGLVAGGHAGYNLQFNQFVVGIEGDLSWSNADGKVTPVAGVNATTETGYYGSVRGRLGIAFNSMLLYGTAGWGTATMKSSVTGPGMTDPPNTSRINGLVFGGGIEAKFSPSISGRLEALHYGLSKKEFEVGVGEIKSNFDQTVIRAGITFHLN